MASGPLVEPTHREGKRWAGGSDLQPVVPHDPAGYPSDTGREVGRLPLLGICPPESARVGAPWLLAIFIQELQPKVPEASVA